VWYIQNHGKIFTSINGKNTCNMPSKNQMFLTEELNKKHTAVHVPVVAANIAVVVPVASVSVASTPAVAAHVDNTTEQLIKTLLYSTPIKDQLKVILSIYSEVPITHIIGLKIQDKKMSRLINCNTKIMGEI
jgi:hypothetical protein